MSFLDMRTIVLGYALTNLICAVVMGAIWFRYKKQYRGLGFWFTDYCLQCGALVLLVLRGVVPDIVSMTIGNAMAVGGTMLLYKGLGLFTGKAPIQWQNTVILVVFLFLHGWFVLAEPNLAARTIIFSAGLLVICAQSAVLMFKRNTPSMRQYSRGLGFIFITFSIVSSLRIIENALLPSTGDFFHSGGYDTLSMLAYQLLYIMLTFGLSLLVNHRLRYEYENVIAVQSRIEAAMRLSEEKFSKAFNSSPDAIILSRLGDGVLLDMNESFCNMTGFIRNEVLGKSSVGLGIWKNPEDREKITKAIQSGTPLRDYPIEVRTKSGLVVQARYSGEIIRLENEDCLLSVVRDDTERMLTEQVLSLRSMLWEYATGHSSSELMQTALDEIEKITRSSIGFYHFVHEDEESLTLQTWSTRTMAEFCKAEGRGMHYPLSSAGVWADCIRRRIPLIHNNYEMLEGKKGMPEGHARVERELVVPTIRDGKVCAVLGVGNKPSDYTQKDVELVMYIADIVWTIVAKKRADEQISELNSRLEQLAITDDLTGIANRRAFFFLGTKEFKKAIRYKTPLIMFMIDIDKFKSINDNYGHAIGDAALQSVAKILAANGRASDIVARLGGEEFGMLLPNTKVQDALVLAERLRSAVAESCCVAEDQNRRVTVSIGIASFHEGMTDLDELIAKADEAMYKAKAEGRNRVECAG